MIRFLLNSGGVYTSKDKGRKYFNDAINDAVDPICPKILMCLFAQVRDDWESKFEKYKNGILEVLDNSEPEFTLAMPDKFEEQCDWADVVVIYGGDDHLFRFWIEKFDAIKIFDGKSVTVQSASSNVLCSSFWTCDWRECFDGLGVVPIRFISHYNSEYGNEDSRGPINWQAAYDELSRYGDTTLPIYALEEGEYLEYIYE